MAILIFPPDRNFPGKSENAWQSWSLREVETYRLSQNNSCEFWLMTPSWRLPSVIVTSRFDCYCWGGCFELRFKSEVRFACFCFWLIRMIVISLKFPWLGPFFASQIAFDVTPIFTLIINISLRCPSICFHVFLIDYIVDCRRQEDDSLWYSRVMYILESFPNLNHIWGLMWRTHDYCALHMIGLSVWFFKGFW